MDKNIKAHCFWPGKREGVKGPDLTVSSRLNVFPAILTYQFFAVLIVSLFFYGCSDEGPYLKSDMKFEKIGDCRNIDSKISIVANTIGERYELQECLHAGFNGQYTAVRRGDTVDVQFEKKDGPTALYKITLDINTRPQYNFLTVNGTTSKVSVTRY